MGRPVLLQYRLPQGRTDLGPAGKLTAVSAALIAAALTHRLVENPIRFNAELIRRPVLSIAGALVITGLCVGTAALARRYATYLGESPQIAATTTAARDVMTLAKGCVSNDGDETLRICTSGDATAETVMVFGDSHAIQTILAARPSLVFLASATNRLRRHLDPQIRASTSQLESMRTALHSVLATLTGAGLHTMFIRDNPEFSFDIRSCLARAARHTSYAKDACEMPMDAVLDPAVADAEKAAIAGLENVRYVDFTDQFCHGGRCGGIRDGQVMYRDADHLTSHFAISLTDVLEPEVLAAMKGH